MGPARTGGPATARGHRGPSRAVRVSGYSTNPRLRESAEPGKALGKQGAAGLRARCPGRLCGLPEGAVRPGLMAAVARSRTTTGEAAQTASSWAHRRLPPPGPVLSCQWSLVTAGV